MPSEIGFPTLTSDVFLNQKPNKQTTIGDKIVETLYLNRVVSENKGIRTPPLSPPLKVGVFVVFYRQLEQGYNIARRGWGRKAIFRPLEDVKKPSFGRSVSTHFVADCLNRNLRAVVLLAPVRRR